ncbi:hypothetical protein ABK040_003834 [Willaertia magna]
MTTVSQNNDLNNELNTTISNITVDNENFQMRDSLDTTRLPQQEEPIEEVIEVQIQNNNTTDDDFANDAINIPPEQQQSHKKLLSTNNLHVDIPSRHTENNLVTFNTESTATTPNSIKPILKHSTSNNLQSNFSIESTCSPTSIANTSDLKHVAFSPQEQVVINNTNNNKDINLNEIKDDVRHEKRKEEYGFALDQLINLCMGGFFGCAKGEEGSARGKPWRYRNYAPIHVGYIIFGGFFFGTIFYLLEMNNSRTNIPWFDAVVMVFATNCLSGFLTQSIQNINVSSQVCLFFALISGGLTLTILPISILKIWRARKRMYKLREEERLKRRIFEINQQYLNLPPVNSVSSTTSLSTPMEYELQPSKNNNRGNDQPIYSKVKSELMKDLNQPEEKEETFLENLKDIFVSNGKPFPLTDVEYSALCWVTIITQLLVAFIVSIGFLGLGGIFTHYPEYLHGKDPFWLGLFIAVSAFNNCGLTLLDENLSNFVGDVGVNLIVGLLVMLGNVFFPLVLRWVIIGFYKFSTKRKIVFKYILEKHHHVSPYLFPQLQTNIYGVVTFVLFLAGVVTTLASDWNRGLSDKPYGVRVLIALFLPASSRTGGFNTMDLFRLSIPTLFVYAFIMRIKPQMACSLRENAYKIVDVIRHLRASEKETSEALSKSHPILNDDVDAATIKELAGIKSSRSLLSLAGEDDDLFIHVERSVEEEEKLKELEEEEKSIASAIETLSNVGSVENVMSVTTNSHIPTRKEKTKKFLGKAKNKVVKIVEDLWYHSTHLLSVNNIWLIILVFAISCAEQDKMKADPANFSVFYIVFEVISAFANSGLTVGVPGSALAYCSFWTPFSKVMLCIVLVMGRHRGFYGTMVDMEEDQYVQDFAVHAEVFERKRRIRKSKKVLKKLQKEQMKKLKLQ